jgi:hypothetical protein
VLPDFDLFNFFRVGVSWLATIYATVVTVQSLYGWWVYLAGQDRYVSLVRRYLIVHGLRLRLTSFFGDVIVCMLLCVAFILLWRAHHVMASAIDAIHAARASVRP